MKVNSSGRLIKVSRRNLTSKIISVSIFFSFLDRTRKSEESLTKTLPGIALHGGSARLADGRSGR